jgi:DNA-binding transcriptional MocR family regulator
VDEALPTTAALAEHYSVSQATIMRVLRARAAEGLMSTVPRWGRCQLLEVGFDEIRLLVSRPLEPRERKGSSEAHPSRIK